MRIKFLMRSMVVATAMKIGKKARANLTLGRRDARRGTAERSWTARAA